MPYPFAILPSGWRQQWWATMLCRQEHEGLKSGEGSWNMAWDARPACGLHHPDSAWLLFGYTILSTTLCYKTKAAEEALPKSTTPRNSSKRTRAAKVHNLSEKRRRSRINEKMKALQNLIPNSNKTDKASMLDEAIEYLKGYNFKYRLKIIYPQLVSQRYGGIYVRSNILKFYEAITGDSVILKFEKARCALQDCLRRVEDIVPQSTCCQIANILNELEGIEFSLDPMEKQIGHDIIVLLQKGRNFNGNCNDNNELESFHQAASKLGITSSRAALRERGALKKLIERVRADEDKRKESIVAYLLDLIRKYLKLFRSDFSDDNDSQGSTPCSPIVHGSLEDGCVPGRNSYVFDRQLSKLNYFNFRPAFKRSKHMPLPPEELRCPISLQIMYDPVIIASGQQYVYLTPF
ncbi:unnamed protein product [Fraxinus pennsylvanica]|uniref:BHLH domain-containing protein n=1 Tax=Fraxinus pennsylvanica TaxID=56036 RepID=A0AAD2E655_9LAMI|nr:unnamed protein product [Fraxinus pennsylvanica]